MKTFQFDENMVISSGEIQTRRGDLAIASARAKTSEQKAFVAFQLESIKTCYACMQGEILSHARSCGVLTLLSERLNEALQSPEGRSSKGFTAYDKNLRIIMDPSAKEKRVRVLDPFMHRWVEFRATSDLLNAEKVGCAASLSESRQLLNRAVEMAGQRAFPLLLRPQRYAPDWF